MVEGFHVGQPVRKIGGDYRFEGWLQAFVTKRSGQVRFVVEDDRGALHIFRREQIEPRVESEEPTREELVATIAELWRVMRNDLDVTIPAAVMPLIDEIARPKEKGE